MNILSSSLKGLLEFIRQNIEIFENRYLRWLLRETLRTVLPLYALFFVVTIALGGVFSAVPSSKQASSKNQKPPPSRNAKKSPVHSKKSMQAPGTATSKPFSPKEPSTSQTKPSKKKTTRLNQHRSSSWSFQAWAKLLVKMRSWLSDGFLLWCAFLLIWAFVDVRFQKPVTFKLNRQKVVEGEAFQIRAPRFKVTVKQVLKTSNKFELEVSVRDLAGRAVGKVTRPFKEPGQENNFSCFVDLPEPGLFDLSIKVSQGLLFSTCNHTIDYEPAEIGESCWREEEVQYDNKQLQFTLMAGTLLRQKAGCFGVAINDRACLGLTSSNTQIDRLRSYAKGHLSWRQGEQEGLWNPEQDKDNGLIKDINQQLLEGCDFEGRSYVAERKLAHQETPLINVQHSDESCHSALRGKKLLFLPSAIIVDEVAEKVLPIKPVTAWIRQKVEGGESTELPKDFQGEAYRKALDEFVQEWLEKSSREALAETLKELSDTDLFFEFIRRNLWWAQYNPLDKLAKAVKDGEEVADMAPYLSIRQYPFIQGTILAALWKFNNALKAEKEQKEDKPAQELTDEQIKAEQIKATLALPIIGAGKVQGDRLQALTQAVRAVWQFVEQADQREEEIHIHRVMIVSKSKNSDKFNDPLNKSLINAEIDRLQKHARSTDKPESIVEVVKL